MKKTTSFAYRLGTKKLHYHWHPCRDLPVGTFSSTLPKDVTCKRCIKLMIKLNKLIVKDLGKDKINRLSRIN